MAVNEVQATPKTGFSNIIQQKSSNLFKTVSEKYKTDTFALSKGREERDGAFKTGGTAALLLGSLTYIIASHKALKNLPNKKIGTTIAAVAGGILMLAGIVAPLINRFDAKKNPPKIQEESMPAQSQPTTEAQAETVATNEPQAAPAPAPAVQETPVAPESAAEASLSEFDAKVDKIAASV